MKMIFGLALLLLASLYEVNAGSACTDLLEKVDQVVEKYKEQEEILTELKEKMHKLETSRCAFSAMGTANGTVRTDNSPIVFPIVKLNTCGGYDEKTGVFTATMAGTYEFNMNVRFQGTGASSGSIYVRKNDEKICSAWVEVEKKNQSKSRDMAACSVVTELVPGDKVTVTGESPKPVDITRNRMGFSGILIYPA